MQLTVLSNSLTTDIILFKDFSSYLSIILLLCMLYNSYRHFRLLRQENNVRSLQKINTKLGQTNKSYLNKFRNMKQQIRDLKKTVFIYKNCENAENTYRDAKLYRKCTNQEKQLLEIREELSESKFQLESVQTDLHNAETVRDKISTIVSEFDTNFTNCPYRSSEWTLTALKSKAKQLNIPLLSKYNWSSRHALAFVIWQVEHLKNIYNSSNWDYDIDFSDTSSEHSDRDLPVEENTDDQKLYRRHHKEEDMVDYDAKIWEENYMKSS